MIEFNLVCSECFKPIQILVDKNDYKAWVDGALIQDVMPYLNSEQREMLKTRTCDTCWDKLFAEQ